MSLQMSLGMSLGLSLGLSLAGLATPSGACYERHLRRRRRGGGGDNGGARDGTGTTRLPGAGEEGVDGAPRTG